MSRDVALLKYHLTNAPKMPINELRKNLKLTSDDEIMYQLVELMERELNNFNFNAHPSNHYILGLCLDYLEYTPSKLKLKNDQIHAEISHKLLKMVNPIETMMDNPGNNKSYLTYKNNHRLLESARDRIINYKRKYAASIVEEFDPAIYEFMYDLVFKYRKIEYLKKVLQEKPNLINVKDKLGKPLMEHAVEKYLSLIHDEHNLVDIFYFENVVTLLSRGYNNKESLSTIQNLIYKKNHEINTTHYRPNLKSKRMEFNLYQIAKCFRMQHLYPTHVQNLNFKYNVNNFFEDDILHAVEKTYMYDPKGYKDYRLKNVFTIDDNNCVFREDAVSFTNLGNGKYELGVYIADIDARIGEGSKLDLEALKRAVSTRETYQYLFPKEFLNNQMSLLKDKDHPVLAYTFIIDDKMNVLDFKVEKAIVNIKNNYNYNDTKDMLNKKNKDHQAIRNLYSVASSIEDIRTNKPYITLKNHPFISHNNPGEYIISEISVFLNSQVAEYFYNNNLPFIYRVDSYDEHKEVLGTAKQIFKDDKSKVVDVLKSYNAPTQLTPLNKGFESLKRTAYGSVTNPGRWYDALVNQRLVKKFMVDNMICDRNTLMHYDSVVAFLSKCLNERNELGYYYKNEVNTSGLTKR